MARPDRDLPIVAPQRPQACGAVRGGLSDEEAAVAARLRELARSAQHLRRAIAEAEPEAAPRLEAALAALRRERDELAASRERAYRRKMIALGHLVEER